MTTAELSHWLADQTWSNFAQSLAKQFFSRGFLSEKQEAAARRMHAKVEARRATPRPPAPEPGFYFVEGSFHRVQENRSKTGVYSKQWLAEPGFRYWEYRGKQDFEILTPEARLTREQAAHFGHTFGRCIRCDAELTDPESVERGIGPICAKKEGW